MIWQKRQTPAKYFLLLNKKLTGKSIIDYNILSSLLFLHVFIISFLYDSLAKIV